MRSAERHLGTYLQLENEQTPWISPAVSTPHRGLSREVSCLSRQNESDGHRPTDVTGSPRSAQKSLVGGGASAPCPPKLNAAKLFSGILLLTPLRSSCFSTLRGRERGAGAGLGPRWLGPCSRPLSICPRARRSTVSARAARPFICTIPAGPSPRRSWPSGGHRAPACSYCPLRTLWSACRQSQ